MPQIKSLKETLRGCTEVVLLSLRSREESYRKHLGPTRSINAQAVPWTLGHPLHDLRLELFQVSQQSRRDLVPPAVCARGIINLAVIHRRHVVL